jgi:metal-responsive CopG/Arc/MetJ family transcriptional regulator
MKTAISLPDSLFRQAELVAKRLGLSRSELYRRALRAFLERHNDQVVTEILDEVYECDAEESRLDHVLEHLQRASVSQERW